MCKQFNVDGVDIHVGIQQPINELPIHMQHTFGDMTHLNDAQRQMFPLLYEQGNNYVINGPTVCLK